MLSGKSRFMSVLSAALGAVAVLPAAQSWATWIPPAGTKVVTITSESSMGTNTKAWALTPTEIDGTYRWILDGSYIPTTDGGVPLGAVTDLSAGIEVDPALSLNFTVTAGAVPTTFTITTAVLGFPAMLNPQAFATAAITVTDNDHDGGMTSGMELGGKSYEARYNAGPVIWADLVGMVMSNPDDSATGNERSPTPSGRTVIPALVNSIQTEFKFTLSANDSASGTSRFDLVPEPASLSLLALGSLALLRRRSR